MRFLGLKFPSLNSRSLEKNAVAHAPENIGFYLDQNGLGNIRQPGKKMTVWQRTLPNAMTHFLNGLCLPMPRQQQFVWHADDDISLLLNPALASFSQSKCMGFKAWREDILHLLQYCRQLSPKQEIKVRLESVSSNGCRLFHTDKIGLRVLCTYRGEGTLWIPEHAIDRTRQDRSNNSHVLDASAVESLGTGWVACLKGDAYPGEYDTGIFHRSPPAAIEAQRILLAIDLH